MEQGGYDRESLSVGSGRVARAREPLYHGGVTLVTDGMTRSATVDIPG